MYEPSNFPLLTLFTFAPVLGALALLLVPSKRTDIIKTVAAGAAAVPLILGAVVFFMYRDSGALQYVETFKWIDGLNVYYRIGMDGLSAPMVVLSGVVGFIAVVASWGIEKQVKGYFALILLLLTGMNGVFVALDFFLFYVFWELMLLPMYFLIGIWGGPKRVYAAIKFFLYTMAGSVLMLVVLLATWYWSDGRYLQASGKSSDIAAVTSVKENLVERRFAAYEWVENHGGFGAATPEQMNAALARFGIDRMRDPKAELVTAVALHHRLANLPPTLGGSSAEALARKAEILSVVELERSFNLIELRERYRLFTGDFVLFEFLNPMSFATLMFIFLYIGFAIKVPVFPFHTWLPWAHVEAPTAISVILAGILLKMGVYGLLRISYALFPTEAVHFAVPIAVLGVFNILYGACCAMAQDDMKKLVAYSSVSHMGFCMLGMAALTKWGLTGSILQMFNHGTSTSMMFLLVGVIYDRAHHRDINRFGGLANNLPRYTALFTLALFASMGLPGLSGFISEALVFLGAFRSDTSAGGISFQSMTILAVLGVILTAAYLLWMMQRVFFGPLNEKYKDYSDINGREIFTLVPLVVMVIFFGVYPQPLLDLTTKSVESLQAHVLRSVGKVSAEKSTLAEDGGSPAAPANEALAGSDTRDQQESKVAPAADADEAIEAEVREAAAEPLSEVGAKDRAPPPLRVVGLAE